MDDQRILGTMTHACSCFGRAWVGRAPTAPAASMGDGSRRIRNSKL